jgi:hypothetical protein
MAKLREPLLGAANKMCSKRAALGAALVSAACVVTPVWCDIDANTSAKNFMKLLFNIAKFGGMILIAAGVVSVVKPLIAMVSGDHVQPNELGKGIGLIIAGIIVVSLKTIISTVTGTDPTSQSFFSTS